MSGGRSPAVLLISPGIIKWTDMDFGLPHLVSIGGWLKREIGEGLRVEILDLNYEGGDQHTLVQTIENLGPLLCIGLSCFSSFDYLRVMTLARFLKKRWPGVPIITGGYHASALPADVVFDGSPFDAVVVGEGERPMAAIVRQLLGGTPLDSSSVQAATWGPDNIEDLDELPHYRWDLLARYWPRARHIGRKFQIYLSRGCPYHCTFCMERAKTEYKWRAYSAERAIDELARLKAWSERWVGLEHWVVNLADPLFGFRRRWRRQVLEGIIEQEIFPRQYWTLTRSDDLDETDVSLLARARFSIGIGLESGSPDMLRRMQKGNTPERYLEAMMRLARLSRDHGLNWASNIIVGHPGETMASMAETRDYLQELFVSAGETCGWLSIDPFRLYPGAYVHEAMKGYTRAYGTRFYHPRWWTSWYDGPFRAEHIDPSTEVDFEARVRFMYRTYEPLLGEIARRFRGQGRSVDQVFRRSLAEQQRLLGPAAQAQVLERGRRARASLDAASGERDGPVLTFPIGLHVRDPWVRRREEAVRRLLERGVLRTEALVEALLSVAPERWLGETLADGLLAGRPAPEVPEGEPAPYLSMLLLAMALEGLEAGVGETIANLTGGRGYVSALLAAMVGPAGQVISVGPTGWVGNDPPPDNVRVVTGEPTVAPPGGPFDRLFVGGALPRFPAALRDALVDGGRAVLFLGPRFRAQDLAVVVRQGQGSSERVIARARVPVLQGRSGWLRAT